MRVLIIRPEREATALAAALSERGHAPVIAPLFRLEFLHPPSDFSANLAACQAVLLTSANGARALAEASDQRGRPILAVGDTTASTAEGLGFSAVTSAAGDGESLVDLVRQRLDPKDGPLLHVSGRDVAFDLAGVLGAPEGSKGGFDVKRVVLYDAHEETALPEPARAALEARALDAATFFSPRAAAGFASMVADAGLLATLRDVTAVAISPAVLAPLAGLPFKATVAAARPTRQAVLDEIDRLAKAGVQGSATMSDAPTAPADSTAADAPSSPPPLPPPARRGLGVVGAFVIGIVAAVIVLAGALVSLPFWPERVQAMWRGRGIVPAPTTAGIDLSAVRADTAAIATAAIDAARRDLTARLDDLDKRLSALAAAAGQPTRPDPATGPAIADLRSKVDALQKQIASAPPATPPPSAATPAPAPAVPSSADAEKEMATLRREIATLQTALLALDQAVAGQRDETAKQREQTRTLAETIGARGTTDKQALALGRASAVIGVAARLSSALDSGRPFAGDLDLLTPLIQGDAKLSDVVNVLLPYAKTGVASRTALKTEFPAVAKAALADDLADDSFGERLLGKVKGIVSLRRVGEDVQGDSAEAKLARAEAALEAGDLAKAVDLMKSLPAQTNKATAAWLARAQAHLAAKQAVDQLSAHAVTLLGAAR